MTNIESLILKNQARIMRALAVSLASREMEFPSVARDLQEDATNTELFVTNRKEMGK